MELIRGSSRCRGGSTGVGRVLRPDGSIDQAITIRSLWASSGTVTFQAGAGIVADSVAEAEHHEVLAKRKSCARCCLRASEVTG
jgi:anthranilate synthase component 1